MSELVWTCADGAVFSSDANGLHLMVLRAPFGGGFRYQVLRTDSALDRFPLASGYREELRDAIAAAERAARGFGPEQSGRALSWREVGRLRPELSS